MTTTPQPWHQNTAIVVLSLLCCWPGGIMLLWRHPTAPQWVKIAVTAWIALSLVIGIVSVVSAFSR